MHFKLLVVFVEDHLTNSVMQAAREAGATGATIINNARGEGIERSRTFFGLDLVTQRDALLLLVEERLARHILERVAEVGCFDTSPGTGIAFQLDVEDALGVAHQMQELVEVVEERS